MKAGMLLAVLVSALVLFLLLSAWVHASAPYIALAIIAYIAWKIRGVFLGKSGDSPDKQE